MWFNSFDFAVFFVIVFALYWILPHRWQNRMLLVASYFFYGCWDWRFLSLIAFSTIVDYVAGAEIHAAMAENSPAAQRRRRLWLVISMVKSLGLLGFFKYYNFFIVSLENLLGGSAATEWLRLDIVLPVGISFYTFQTMSYAIDVYRGVMKPARRPSEFALFVAFFPQLVAGPIERASALLPQVENKRHFNPNQFLDGLHLIFWGLVKKVFVADNLAVVAGKAFDNPDPTGFGVICGVYAFAFQIYCDFSAYSDIARGCAKCLGFELRLNFNLPYIAVNPRDFWSRWHISLSTWLRDYLYIPLGGNRHGTWRTYQNLVIVMLLGGLWHGALWTFVLWGAYHGALLITHRLLEPLLKRITPSSRAARGVWYGARMLFMFHLVCVGWLFFRAQSAGQIYVMIENVCHMAGTVDWSLLLPLLAFAGPLLFVELLEGPWSGVGSSRLKHVPAWIRCPGYAVFFYLLAFYGASAQSFIYFQF